MILGANTSHIGSTVECSPYLAVNLDSGFGIDIIFRCNNLTDQFFWVGVKDMREGD